MSDAEWLRKIADAERTNCRWTPEAEAMLRRVADRLDAKEPAVHVVSRHIQRLEAELDRLRALNAEAVNVIRELIENGSWCEIPFPLRHRLRKAADGAAKDFSQSGKKS